MVPFKICFVRSSTKLICASFVKFVLANVQMALKIVCTLRLTLSFESNMRKSDHMNG